MLDNRVHMQEETATVIQAIIIISAIFVLVAIFVIAYVLYFRKRKERLIQENTTMREAFRQQLLLSQVEVQEQTFQQIGKELHDNVGQLLSTTNMLLGLTERGMDMPPDTLLTAHATLTQAIGELRTLSKSLDRDWLEQFNLADNLRSEIARINTGGIVQASFIITTDLPLPSDEQIILFRIVQEAIQNAIKHGQPQRINIVVMSTVPGYCISIEDDGQGFDLAGISPGQGMGNMKNRTNLLGGSLLMDALPGRGCTIKILLPDKL
jgi:signal transduction histidine kinase